jgi:threonyl-tRNA synthetase
VAEPVIEIHEHDHGDELDIHDHPDIQGDPLSTMRHSTAHIMAEAVLGLFPDAKIGIGPVIEHGFYYDFLLPRALSPDDLGVIEERMRAIIAKDTPFIKTEVPKPEALQMFHDQPFKSELISEIQDPEVRIYNQGGFTDLCRGPHMPSTGKVGAFKLLSVAGRTGAARKTARCSSASTARPSSRRRNSTRT